MRKKTDKRRGADTKLCPKDKQQEVRHGKGI